MENKIKVTAKAQNQLALGIAHAYALLHPEADLAAMRVAFPTDIAPDKGVEELFLPEDEAIARNANMSLYFAKPDQVIVLGNGEHIALSQVWTRTSLDNLLKHIADMPIEANHIESEQAKVEGIKGFRIDYLNGFKPVTAVTAKKGGFLAWLKSLFCKK